jgi:hypothetical protein
MPIGEKKIDKSKIPDASLKGTNPKKGITKMSGHTDVFYSKGKVYMSGLSLHTYFKMIFCGIDDAKSTTPEDNPFGTRSIFYPGTGMELSGDAIRRYYFTTEPDAVFAFSHVYGGTTSGEWGARIMFDDATGYYYLDAIKHFEGTSADIPKIRGMTAAVHTHPYPTTAPFSNTFPSNTSSSDLTSAKDQQVNEYVVHTNGRVYQAIYDEESDSMIGVVRVKDGNANDPDDTFIGDIADWCGCNNCQWQEKTKK